MRQIDNLQEVFRHRTQLRQFIHKLNINEANDLTCEISVMRSYYAVRPSWYPNLSSRDVVFLRRIERLLEARIAAGCVKPELSCRGSVMTRSKFPFGDTLEFSQRFLTDAGWKLMHGEGGYVGIWLNDERLELYVYYEGDVCLYKAKTRNDLYGELLNFDIDHELVV